MDLLRRAPCCGFEWTVQEYEPRGPIFWNPYNNVVQCHNCGQSFVPAAEAARPRVETTPAGATVDTPDNDLATLAGMEHAKNEYATLASNRWTEIERLREALEMAHQALAWATHGFTGTDIAIRARDHAAQVLALPKVDTCQPLPPHTTASSTVAPVSDAAAEPKIMRTGRANWTWRSECGGAWYISLNERAAAPYLRQIHVEAIVDLDARGLVAGIEIIDEKMPGPPLGVSAEPKRSE